MARILVAGTEGWCRSITSRLESCGHEVVCAHDALDAAELALDAPTAAIITQSVLARASGAQLCRLVQAELPHGELPVVVMSDGTDDPGAAYEARAAGAIAHVRDVEGLLRALPGIVARPLLSPPPRRASRRELGGRLSAVLDRALRDGEIAADVRALASAESLERMFEGLVSLASQVVPYAWLGLVIAGDSPSFLLHAATEDHDAEAEARAALGIDATQSCTTVRTAASRRAVPREVDAQDAIEVPIFFGDALVGQLAVKLTTAKDADARRTVGLVAHELGGPLRIMTLLEQVQRQAATDALTGLLNRRAFLDLVTREHARSMRNGAPTSFLVVDIDHFKRVNDVHGHPAGDAVLTGVARVFAETTRATDVVSRWGGEEFVIALPQTDMRDAQSMAERVRAQLERTAHLLPGGASLMVTVSIGFATAYAPWSIEQVLAAADAALYEAKSGGRNRVRPVSSSLRPDSAQKCCTAGVGRVVPARPLPS